MCKGLKDVSKYKGDIVCPCCGSIRINKFCKQNNKQRYICRDCRKTFITEESSVKRYDDNFKLEAIGWYLEGVGIRSIERRMGVTDTSIINWIRNMSNIIKDKLDSYKDKIINKDNIDILEVDENKDRILENK